MKQSFEVVKLSDVCNCETSNLALKNLENNFGEYSLYGASGFIKNVDFYKQDKDYIGIVKDGAGIGRVMLLERYSSILGTMQYIIPKENINIKYLYYNLIKMNLSKYFTGSTIPHIYFKDYKNEKIFLRTLSEQKKISNILDNVSKILEMKKQQLSEFDKLVKFQFLKIFGDPILNEKNWKTEKLFKVAPITQYIGKFDEKIWLLNLDMIEANTGKIIKYNYTNLENIPLSTYKFSEENVLYSKLRPYLNKVVIPNNRGYVTSEMLPLKPNPLLLNRYFFAYLLRCETFVDFIKNKVSGTKMPRVSMEELKQFDCILPPIELQNKFADFVKQVNKSKVELQKSIDETQLLFDSLMDKYFG